MTFVQITPVDGKGAGMQIDLVGEDTVGGGAGGWGELPRPRRTPAVEWLGTPLKTLTLPLLLDGTERRPGVDRSIEPDIRTIIEWASKDDALGQPPVLQVRGPVATTPSHRWVIQDIAWGPMIRDAREQRVQQYLNLTLWEYAEAEVLRGPARKWRGKS